MSKTKPREGSVRAGIQHLLNSRVDDSTFLISKYHPGLETQILVHEGLIDSEAGNRSWTDGKQTWSDARWPYKANSEPHYSDKTLTYDPGTHVKFVGTTWWDFENKQSIAIGLDIDTEEGHAVSTTTVTPEKLEEIIEMLKRLPYVTLVHSKSGQGIHIYVFFKEDDLPVAENHNVHKTHAIAVLAKMCKDMDYDLGQHVDAKGSVFWLWADKIGKGGFDLIRDAQENIGASDLKGYYAPEIPPTGTVSDYRTICLDETHKEILKALEDQPFESVWVKEHNMLQTHTVALKQVHKAWGLAGDFETLSNGKDTKVNCYITPRAGGVFKVTRYSDGVAEHDSWEHADKTFCFFNQERPEFTNCVWIKAPKLKEKKEGDPNEDKDGWHGIPLPEMTQALRDLGLMPNRLGRELFVKDGDGIRVIVSREDLFAWLKTHVTVLWRGGKGATNQNEFYCHLQHVAPDFKEISTLPHEPLVPEVYYAHGEFTPGGKLEGFLNFLCPLTEDDRQLLKAALLTMFWGGPPGTRPVFNITAPSGRGSGKTTAAEFILDLAGGSTSVSDTNIKDLITRLLSPEARGRRGLLLDNLKSDRFDCAGLEQLITAKMISGRKLFHGEGARLNLQTLFITVNGGQLSTDMAQRAVVIKLDKPQNDPLWLTRFQAYVEENREAIIGDCLEALAGPKNAIGDCSRWATWEGAVLAIVDNPEQLQELILERQQEVDGDKGDAQAIEDYLADAIEAAGLDHAGSLHISNKDLQKVFNRVFDKLLAPGSVTKALNQMVSERQITRLVNNPSHKKGRGFIWNVSPDEPVNYELRDKLFACESWSR